MLRRVKVRPAVERDNPRVVHHLVHDRNIPRGLRNPEDVAVARRRDDRAGNASAKATVREIAVLPRIGGAAAAPRGGERGLPLSRVRREGRDAAVGRIDDAGRARRFGIPELVPVHRSCTGLATNCRCALRVPALAFPEQFRQLLVLELLVAREPVRALEGRAHVVVERPDAFEIGVAPRRARRRVFRRLVFSASLCIRSRGDQADGCSEDEHAAQVAKSDGGHSAMTSLAPRCTTGRWGEPTGPPIASRTGRSTARSRSAR